MKMKMFGVCAALSGGSACRQDCSWTNTPGRVTFNVTPSAVSNTYAGTITCKLTVDEQDSDRAKFLDLNTNGVIDDADLLVQQFTVQDGSIL